MRSFLSILALLFLFAGATSGQDASGNGPVMKLVKTEVDYGEILQGSDPLRVFVFTNTGNEPLIITDAKGSCGCTVPSYPKEPILPGEKSKIEVRYDTNRVGPFMKTVTLTTNEVTPSHTLKIKGSVKAKPAGENVPASQGSGG